MADEGNLVSDVMTTPEQVLAAGGVSKRRRGASRRSPSGQRRRAPTPEPPKDLPLDPDEELELKSEISPTKPQISPTKPQVSPTKPQISPIKSDMSPIKPQLSPTKSEISPVKPQLSPTKSEISPTKPTTVKRISTTEKTLVTKRSHSSPGENRQSLTSTITTFSDVKQEPPFSKYEEHALNTEDVPQSRPVVVKRKSTTQKTLVTKRSLSSPGEGRQSFPQSGIIDDLKQEKAAPTTIRRLSDDADRIIGDGAPVTLVKKSPLTYQPPVKTEEIVRVKKTIQEEKPVESAKTSKTEDTVPKKQLESVQVSAVEKIKTEEVSFEKKPEEETLRSPPEEKKSVEEVEETKPETEDEKSPLLSVEEDEKKVKEAIWGPFFREMWHEWKKFVAQHDEQWGKIVSQRNRCIGALVVVIIYCGIGGLIFRFTEGAFESFYKCGVKRVKRDFVESLWLGSHHMREDDWKSQARNKLMELENQLHAAHEAGVTSYSGQRAWSFLNAVVYCLTVVTTIGYGHISPSTTTGRAITIVYAIFGIPMFLILLADFGKLFTRGIKFIWAFVRRVYYTGSCKKVRRTVPVQEVMKGVQLVYDFATFRRPSQMVGESGEDGRKAPIAHSEDLELQVPLNPPQLNQAQPPTTLPLDGNEAPIPGTPALSTFEVDDEFNLPISVAIVILLIYIFVGATIYWTWEKWGFFESFYFVFISMSTIGFGDFVPQHPMYMMASIVYLVFGLALTSMCINVVQEKLSDSFRQASAKIGATIGLRVKEEDGAITPVPPPHIELPEVHNAISKSHST